MSFKQSLEYVRSKRSIICPNEGFQRQLKRYELTLKRSLPQLEKDKEKVEENMVQSEQFQEKQVIMEFLKDQKKEESRPGMKMNATVGNGQGPRTFMSTKQKDYKGLLRGNSLNYGKKTNSNLLSQNGSKGNRQTGSGFRDESRETSKLTKQFLTFKLQTPKIVTIKK